MRFAISGSFVVMTPPSPQMLMNLSGCSENAPITPHAPAGRSSRLDLTAWQASSITGMPRAAAIASRRGMSTMAPVMCTGMIALVRGVMAASNSETSTQKSSLQSTNFVTAPVSAIAPTVAMNVLAAVMTSSPGPTPRAFNARRRPSVPDPTPNANCTPTAFANRASNSPTALPSVKSPVAITSRKRAKMGSGSANCSGKYEKGTRNAYSSEWDQPSGVPRSTLGHACTAGGDDVVTRGIELLLKLAARGHSALRPCYTPRPAAHLAQRFDDGRDDFGGGPVHPPAGLRHDEAPGFFHRGDDACDVERHQAAKVNYFGIDVGLGQGVRGLQCDRHHRAHADKRDILACAAHQRFTETNEIRGVGNVLLHREKRPPLDKEGRIVAHNAGEKQPLRIRRRRGHDHLQARHMREPGMETLGVLRPLPPALADDRTDRHGHLRAATRHETPRRHPVDHLVHRIEHEVEPLVNDHRAQAGIGCAGCERG